MKTNNSIAKNLSQCALFVALLCVSAYVAIPFYPVAITFQAAVCLLGGAVLGAKKGAFCAISYALIGLLGVPVFSGFTGGFSIVIMPSFGYIMGVIPAAAICGLLIHKQKSLSYLKILFAQIIGLLIIYVIGISYFAFIWVYYYNGAQTLWHSILFYNVLYLPKDLTLIAIFAVIIQKIFPLINKV